MKRTSHEIENEIVSQILIAELCFDICKDLPIEPGLGPSFLPFFHNLSISRGLIILHSLLISPFKTEIALKQYVAKYCSDKEPEEIADFQKKIGILSKKFKNSYHGIFLRHKVAAHLDERYQHQDFTSAYLANDKIKTFISITSELKEVFFEFTNWSQSCYLENIKKQSEDIVRLLQSSPNNDYQL